MVKVVVNDSFEIDEKVSVGISALEHRDVVTNWIRG
jgi:hypothetical protein